MDIRKHKIVDYILVPKAKYNDVSEATSFLFYSDKTHSPNLRPLDAKRRYKLKFVVNSQLFQSTPCVFHMLLWGL